MTEDGATEEGAVDEGAVDEGATEAAMDEAARLVELEDLCLLPEPPHAAKLKIKRGKMIRDV